MKIKARLPINNFKNKALYLVSKRPDIIVVVALLALFLYLASVFLGTISPALNFEPVQIEKGIFVDDNLRKQALDDFLRHQMETEKELQKNYPNSFR